MQATTVLSRVNRNMDEKMEATHIAQGMPLSVLAGLVLVSED